MTVGISAAFRRVSLSSCLTYVIAGMPLPLLPYLRVHMTNVDAIFRRIGNSVGRVSTWSLF